MSISNSPYAAFASLLSSNGHSVSPAELHGLLIGRSCAGSGFEPEPWLLDASDLLASDAQEPVRQALLGLQQMVKAELTGEEVAVVLLLPNDEAPLAERAIALGQWCQGFLAGFGLTARDTALSAEAMEVLQDLAAIAQIQDALEESEDGENDYMEVTEYLRIAPMLLFAECVRPVQPAAAKPSLH
jgi:uncharacterized protein YgfB (UPF0149 family)